MSNPAVVRKRITSSGGRFFSAWFIKRTDGELRHMVAKLGVRKDIKGVGMAYDPSWYDLITVWDVQKQDYRMISLDSVLYLKVNGKIYQYT